ncbi:unnamed protein product [Orchesella dallaii]|uniref:Uncharacterized protein n=1 Tax=Orchesella dallaii TaxID=48710 RepID=A0ABP1QH67_9HEXA
MWTTNILLFSLQLQIIWINPCSGLSSTNESFVAVTNQNLDLRVTYEDILDGKRAGYTIGCNTIVMWKTEVHFPFAVSFCIEEGYRLLRTDRPKEMSWLEKVLNDGPWYGAVWVFNPSPENALKCYYALLDNNNKLLILSGKCIDNPLKYVLITVDDTLDVVKCQPIDVAKF